MRNLWRRVWHAHDPVTRMLVRTVAITLLMLVVYALVAWALGEL